MEPAVRGIFRKNGVYYLPYTDNIPCDIAPVEGSLNYLKSGAVYTVKTNLESLISQRAPSVHSHTISHVSGLQGALDGKLSSSHDSDLNAHTYGFNVLEVREGATISGGATFKRDVNIEGTLNVGNNIFFQKSMDINGSIEVNNRATIYSGTTIYGGANISGGATIYNGAGISGGALIHGSTVIEGSAALKSGATINGSTTIFGNTRLNGSATFDSGAKIYNGAEIHGSTVFCNGAVVSNGADINGGVTVNDGTATFYGNTVIKHGATISSGAVISGGATINGETVFKGSRVVCSDGGLLVSGGVLSVVNGAFYLNNRTVELDKILGYPDWANSSSVDIRNSNYTLPLDGWISLLYKPVSGNGALGIMGSNTTSKIIYNFPKGVVTQCFLPFKAGAKIYMTNTKFAETDIYNLNYYPTLQ